MKAYVLYILMALGFFSVNAQRSNIRIAYVDMEYILQNVEEYQMANEQLAKKVQKWKSEAEDQEATIQKMWADLNAEKVLLTKELIQEREEEINALERQMKDYQQDRFGPQGDLIRQRGQLVKPIQDQVFTAVQELAEAKQYDFIFDKSADVVMLYSDKRYDISDQILRKINALARQDGENAEDDEDLEEIDPELKERQDAYDAKKEEAEQEMEARREAKLKEIEARKKAYEERRQKMLEDREARRKAKAEEREKLKEENNSTTTGNEENE